MQRISVWFITGPLPPRFSGAGKNDLLLAPHCIKHGLDITLVAPRYPGDAASETIGNVKVLRIPRKERSFRILAPLSLIKHLYFNPPPDLIRMRGFSFSLALTVFLLKIFFPRIKIVVQPAMFGGDDPVSIRKKRGGFFVKRQLMNVDAIFSMNQLFRESFLRCGFPENRIYMVHNPVDIENFYPVAKEVRIRLRRQLGLPEEGFIMTTLGIFHSRKNQSLITQAFIKFLSDGIGENTYLVHVGPTAKDLPVLGRPDAVEKAAKEEARLNAVMRKSRYSQNVLTMGHRENPAPYLQASDLFVHASTKEGEANVINEALACGLPCLVPDTPPYRTQAPSSCAYRFSPGDAKALSNGMKLLISDKALRVSMAKSAIDHILITRTPDKAAAYYAELLNRIARLPR